MTICIDRPSHNAAGRTEPALRAKCRSRYYHGVHGPNKRGQTLRRRFVAAAFLLFLLAEWGSHTAVHINNSTVRAAAVSAAEDHREDPCRSLVLCSDSRRRDRQTLNVAHDLMPPVTLAGASAEIALLSATDRQVQPFHTADGLTRPPDPHFRPPQLA
ncbi:MAG: hypothetical protein KBD94_06080 [Pyrinomonadaceae bacterium]|nr:hypothetical protein [Pyrinomonadaceae bacterium]